jgi:murein DD-endopeptidase / murein LD-carboxypeptidase
MKKNLLIVSVALSVFTVTSLTTLAQPKRDFLRDNYIDGYNSGYKNEPPQNSYSKNANNALEEFATEQCSPTQFKFAQLLDREVETLTNTYLFNFIDEWWAVRYRYGGTTMRGVDCSSYTGQLLYTVYGTSMPRTAREQYRVTGRVRKDELQEGDLVFFNTRGGVSHVGIYISDGYFTHSSCSKGVTISNLNETYYSKKFISGGRVVEQKKYGENIQQIEVIQPDL